MNIPIFMLHVNPGFNVWSLLSSGTFGSMGCPLLILSLLLIKLCPCVRDTRVTRPLILLHPFYLHFQQNEGKFWEGRVEVP